jgi:hypothetical protein
MIQATLGFRVHSGWAALVALALPGGSKESSRGAVLMPSVICRSKLALATSGSTTQPYHAAQSVALKRVGAAGLADRGAKQRAVQQSMEALDLASAEELIRHAATESRRIAGQGLKAVIHELVQKGYEPSGCAILCASGRLASTLAATLSSHTAIHTAEGELFRRALADACQNCGLRVIRIRERDLFGQGSVALGIPHAELQHRLSALGEKLGPPWRQDQKYAALAAWIALFAPCL